ncbi:MAG TPA: hypothetical protein VIL25_00850 [Vicinamibacterales bacterium]
MAHRLHSRGARPAPLPDIRADGDSVIFNLDVAGAWRGARLVLRCDASGEVWASLSPEPANHQSDRAFRAGA